MSQNVVQMGHEVPDTDGVTDHPRYDAVHEAIQTALIQHAAQGIAHTIECTRDEMLKAKAAGQTAESTMHAMTAQLVGELAKDMAERVEFTSEAEDGGSFMMHGSVVCMSNESFVRMLLGIETAVLAYIDAAIDADRAKRTEAA